VKSCDEREATAVSKYGHMVGIGIGCSLVMLSGCTRGPDRFDVTGQVTFRGQSVSVGRITFVPAGNEAMRGAPGFAAIRDGHFDTSTGRSPGAGRYRFMVDGFDGVPFRQEISRGTFDENPLGKPLFETYSLEVDLPERSGHSLTIEVPDAPVQRPRAGR